MNNDDKKKDAQRKQKNASLAKAIVIIVMITAATILLLLSAFKEPDEIFDASAFPRRTSGTSEPVITPTDEPTPAPTEKPTPEPTEEPTPVPTPRPVLYSDDKVEISFYGIESQYSYRRDAIVFWVKNKTNATITIQHDSVALDGIDQGDATMSDDIAPQSEGKVYARLDGYSSVQNPSRISGQLRVIDFEDSFDTYKAKFVNVSVV